MFFFRDTVVLQTPDMETEMEQLTGQNPGGTIKQRGQLSIYQYLLGGFMRLESRDSRHSQFLRYLIHFFP